MENFTVISDIFEWFASFKFSFETFIVICYFKSYMYYACASQ